MAKVKSYTRKAIKDYQSKFDTISNIMTPLGTKDRIKNYGYSLSEFGRLAILEKLDQLDKANKN